MLTHHRIIIAGNKRTVQEAIAIERQKAAGADKVKRKPKV